ncbi:hypothetical protein [Clostridium paridis]|uniref:Uncharacterized protein n=1 Tax=Clostridium paridis TaxID=2803863 RepID=A0A937FB95_9CLOT|nr:hypothetical protein [Clostridium paridis]MBL4930905.1 hypothetical protein [Clostridium paridis]
MEKQTILRFLKNITKDNIADLLVLIPTIGIPLSIGTKLVIGGLDSKADGDDEHTNKELKNQISKIEDLINQYGIEEIKNQITKAILDEIDKENSYDLVYISGVTIAFGDGEVLTKCEKESITHILSGYYENEIINDFMDQHCSSRDYLIFEDRMYLNFDNDEDMFSAVTTLNLRKEIIFFIDMINKIRAGRTLFSRYKFY